MNLYKLRHLHNFEGAREEDSITVESGSLKPWWDRQGVWNFCQPGLVGSFRGLHDCHQYSVRDSGTFSSPPFNLLANHDSGWELWLVEGYPSPCARMA